MAIKKNLLVISFSHLERDPRVSRQIHCLTADYNVIAAGLSDPQIDGVGFIPLSFPEKGPLQKMTAGVRLLFGAFENQYWKHPRIIQAWKQLKDIKADVVLANDIEALPLALKVAGDANTIFDAHEYAPREFEDLLGWNIFYKRYKTYLCKEYLPKVYAMMTVSQGIANEYQKQFGIYSHVITNAPEFAALSPSSVKDSKIRMVCHSYAMPSRKLETLIDMFEHLDDRFEMALILMPFSDGYLEELKKRAKKHPKIHFPPTVPMHEIVSHLNKYDLGVYLLPPTSFNNAHALPNKLFEFIQARLAIAIGPSPEMSAIIAKYQCGIASKDFTPKSLAECINLFDKQHIETMKNNAGLAAHDLCAENNKFLIQDIVSKAVVDLFQNC
jgi:hypothetical protein